MDINDNDRNMKNMNTFRHLDTYGTVSVVICNVITNVRAIYERGIEVL
jgi:hypothetical protein